MKTRSEYHQISESESFNPDLNFFENLPALVKLNIWYYLDPLSLAQLCKSSHFFRDNYILRQKLKKSRSEFLAFNELTTIFMVQTRRLLSLSADFSEFKEDAVTKKILLSDFPILDISKTTPTIRSQLLDHGRANSFLLEQKYSNSFYQDWYHREAAFGGQGGFNLVTTASVLNTQYESTKLIALDVQSIIRVSLYLVHKKIVPNEALIFQPIPFFGTIPVLKVHRSDLNDSLHDLGMLGALPSRDWQLNFYCLKKVDNLAELRDLYFKMIKGLSRFPIGEINLDKPIAIEFSYQQKKEEIIKHLESLVEHFSKDLEDEQRGFYCQFLIKLLRPLSFIEKRLDKQEEMQLLLSLQRLHKVLKPIQSLSYPNFLRSIETSIDEITLLLSLQNSQVNHSATSVSENLKQFLEETVGLRPTMATLRTSGMQAIWSSLQLALTFYMNRDEKLPSLTFMISQTAYFEIFGILELVFNISRFGQDIYLEATDEYSINALIPHRGRIYDLYIGNFESNILLNSNYTRFTDINAFVRNQFELRDKENCANRPLILLLDNTMSDFNEVYIPSLLLEFEKEIEIGRLALIISHSGNKYLHLGSDKALAGLLYGYYNPLRFASIDNEIQHELLTNQLGSFESDSPTLLLTQAFMQYGKNEILAYSAMIRRRTAYLFEKAIPAELIGDSTYLTIDSPFCLNSAKVLESYSSCLNNTGFIIIKINDKYFPGEDVHSQILGDLQVLSKILGIHGRDGFGFSQTTRVVISRPGYPSCIRYSIGTEALDELVKKFSCLCNYLLMMNLIMEKYRFDTKGKTAVKMSTQSIQKELGEASAIFLAGQKQEYLTEQNIGFSFTREKFSFFSNSKDFSGQFIPTENDKFLLH